MVENSALEEIVQSREKITFKTNDDVFSYIRIAFLSGKYDTKNLAQIIDMDEKTLKKLINFCKNRWLQKQAQKKIRNHMSEDNRLRDISYAVGMGVNDLDKLSAIIGLKDHTLRMYAAKLGIYFPRKNMKRMQNEDNISKIRQAVNNGAKTIEDIINQTRIKRVTLILNLAEQNNIKLPVDIDSLISSGEPGEKIGEVMHLTREGVRKYLIRSGKFEMWKKAVTYRDNKKGRKSLLKDILAGINARILQFASPDERWCYQKAMEYQSSLRANYSRQISLDRLVLFFKRYKTAEDMEAKLSLKELASGLLSSSNEALRILNTIGLTSLYWKLTILSEEQEQAIKNSFSLKISCNDIAYFLNINYPLLMLRFNKNKVQSKGSVYITQIRHKKLTYSLASQIYQAQDIGFNSSEISELFDRTQEIIEYALSNREQISLKIMHSLRILYPKREINNPYIESSA